MNLQNDFNRTSKPQLAPPAPEKIENPQVPEHKPKQNFVAPDENFDDDDEDPICGPAETISGTLVIIFSINLS